MNLAFYAWKFLLLSIVITHIHAHGGEGGEDDSPIKTSANEQHGTIAEGNVGLAFGLLTMTALSSALGSFTPFLDLIFPYIPSLAHIKITESRGLLAGSLSFSSGILLFLTLGDLFPEAIESFNSSGLFDKKYSNLVAASIFIFTALSIMILKFLIRKYRRQNKQTKLNDDEIHEDLEEGTLEQKESPGCDSTVVSESHSELVNLKTAKKIKSLGIQIAVALAFHNFPEGLALFTATLGSEHIGILFAIALSLHKIPEGLMISLPIYYSTDSRWKAFAIAASVGIISQMLGGILGYVLFVTIWNAVSGFIFSIVTAALLYAILHGMLPMAHHYDPEDKYVTVCTFSGIIFLIIVNSLIVLFGSHT